jgi:hypothetical protein
MNDDIGERHAAAEACAERLQHRLLCGEPTGEAFDPIGSVTNLIELSLHKAAGNKRVARILDPAAQGCHLDQVDAVPDDIHNGGQPLAPATWHAIRGGR